MKFKPLFGPVTGIDTERTRTCLSCFLARSVADFLTSVMSNESVEELSTSGRRSLSDAIALFLNLSGMAEPLPVAVESERFGLPLSRVRARA